MTHLARTAILSAARSPRVKAVVAGAPVSRSVVRRFVAGEAVEDAIRTTTALREAGLNVSLDHLGEDTFDAGQAQATVEAYRVLLGALGAAGLAEGGRAEVSVKLTAIGQAIDPGMALDNARMICAAADAAGTCVTLDAEDHTTTDATLRVLQALRQDFPKTGAVLQAYLHRTEGDCQDLASAGSRVRLCKGAYREPASVAFQHPSEVNEAYERCLRILMGGGGYPMVATHDPHLIQTAGALTDNRSARSYEYQMLLGVRPLEQRRLAGLGETVRVYVPYGSEWYGYLMRRLAERPANVAFLLRALTTRS